MRGTPRACQGASVKKHHARPFDRESDDMTSDECPVTTHIGGMMRLKWGAALLLALATSATSAQVIRITPSPGDKSRLNISTPWGDFIAEERGGSMVVMPAAQYAKRLGDANLRKSHIEVNAIGREGTVWISKDSVTVNVGPVRLRNVSASIVIGVPPSKELGRPPKPKNTEYVQFVWMQEGAGKVGLNLSIDGQALKPNNCRQDEEIFHCEYTVPHSLIPKPADAVFTLQNKVPGVWHMESLSKAHYDDVKRKAKEMREPMSEEDRADLDAIRKIDPTIPAS